MIFHCSSYIYLFLFLQLRSLTFDIVFHSKSRRAILALLGGHLQELKFVDCQNVNLVEELQTCTSLEALRLDSSTMEDLFDSNYNIPSVARIKILELEVDDEKMEEFLVFAATLKSESLTSLGINFIYSVPVSSTIF